MSEKRASAVPVEDKLDEIARLLALNIKRDRTLQIAITELASVGFQPTRIAELLGTTAPYVRVAISRAKKKANAVKPAPDSEA